MKLSRREFIKSSIAAGFFIASSRSTLGQMMGGGGGGIIDPPIGGVFKDPVEMTFNAAGEVDLEAKVAPVNKRHNGESFHISINPNAQKLNPDDLEIMLRRTLTLSMGHGNAYINGQDFDVDPYTIMSDVGTYEIWTIVNESGMDHPFHQHVNAAQILAINGGDAGYASLYTSIPAWKDTVLVPLSYSGA